MALAACGVLLILSACAGNTVIQEVEDINTDSTDPMKFSCQLQQGAQGQRANAATLLTSDFIVDTYKAYATPKQQCVMQRFHVRYSSSGNAWNGDVQHFWEYNQVDGQELKYWDYSHFPYRFHAVAPYTNDAARVSFDDRQLQIQAPYYAQTCTNGLITTHRADGSITTENPEPYIVAQVHRGTDGRDTDLLAIDPQHTNLNNATTTRHREVWMPFHHLNSKIRFAVYALSPWVTANLLYIKNLRIKVTTDDFVTAATGYSAACSGTGSNADPFRGWRDWSSHSGFTGLSKAPAASLPLLFRFDGGRDVPGNDLRDCQTQRTAFFLQCPDGIMQLPQTGVRLTISFDVYDENDQLYKAFSDVPIEYELDGTHHPLHTWQSGYIYTYYFILGSVDDKLGITFTCTLTPWEDITGSLSTDLEQ